LCKYLLEKVDTYTFITNRNTYKWNFKNLNNCQIPEDLRILALFSYV
jgi:hypothetical protein